MGFGCQRSSVLVRIVNWFGEAAMAAAIERHHVAGLHSNSKASDAQSWEFIHQLFFIGVELFHPQLSALLP